MEKNKYLLSLTKAQPVIYPGDVIHIPVESHDELFGIIKRIESKKLFSTEEDAAAFAITVKIFTEFIVRDRKTPLFRDFLPHMKKFLQELKSLVSQPANNPATPAGPSAERLPRS
ncbi:DUF3861 family protein [Mucilaginibacter pedocola]|uniref:DUF3861 domain-containing protein n=1 Tax=Mucilaginibacter pedocola TaxID=1792845 RepID=A0A1S9PA76_9SPHI|nr:DUF3861 family protein [Mucilaginibacter pedocola]OOQ57845.1 hypothetical protein BC343_13785 [Mucilaginibacter pedocola]